MAGSARLARLHLHECKHRWSALAKRRFWNSPHIVAVFRGSPIDSAVNWPRFAMPVDSSHHIKATKQPERTAMKDFASSLKRFLVSEDARIPAGKPVMLARTFG